MQLAVQDIRRLGFKKIAGCFYKSAESKVAFYERLRQENCNLSKYKASAYSLPKYYSSIKNDLVGNYNGFIRFIDFCNPMLGVAKVDSVMQRKVRNQWDSVWKSIQRDLVLTDADTNVLRELGIRIALAEEHLISIEIFDFYNAILSWYVYTSSEGNLNEVGLDFNDILEVMVLESSQNFLDTILKGLGG